MTDAPKRQRGRPRKAPGVAFILPEHPDQHRYNLAQSAQLERDTAPWPTHRLRIRAGAIQQAWQHPTGIEWRAVPVVPDNAPDWEDA